MGNTFIKRGQISRLQDHPHIHGEYRIVRHINRSIFGSPPHTWGIHTLVTYGLGHLGITPTYMGNINLARNHDSPVQDHPHIHGEYNLSASLPTVNWGSPPHTWGIRADRCSTGQCFRITPTYMGNTVNRSLYDAFFRSLVCYF